MKGKHKKYGNGVTDAIQIVALDRKKYIRVAEIGTTTLSSMHIKSMSILCTDGSGAYKEIANKTA